MTATTWLELPTGKHAHSILHSDQRLNVWTGSVRSGKTVSSIIRWLGYVADGPPGELLMIGKTERTLKRNILDVIEQLIGKQNFRLVQGSGECFIYGRRIYIAGANDERAVDKIKGITLAGAYGDEVTTWPESFFKMLLSRLSLPGAKLFATTNPDSPFHWLKTDYLDRDGLSLAEFHFTLDDNLALDPEYVENLKREYTGLWYRRYIDGLWVLAEGLVYDMFDPDIHIIDTLPAMRQEWVGIDYGTSNPTAFLLVGSGDDGRLYVTDEYFHKGDDMTSSKTDAEYSVALREWLGERHPRWLFIDPSAKSFRTQLHRDRRTFPVFGKTAKGNNDVLDGIRKVSNVLSAGRLFIHRRCANLSRELGVYSWDPKAQERGEDKPLQKNDHTCDALRYVIASIGTVYERVMRTA